MANELTQLKYANDIEYTFTDSFDMNELKCIEIESDMIDDLQNGKLEIRGDTNDEAVLVTSNKSYKIRQHDSSNTILLTSLNHKDRLLHNLQMTKESKQNRNENSDLFCDSSQNNRNENEIIFNAVSCIYVLEAQPPKLSKLQQILYQRPYKGIPTPEASPDDDDSKETTLHKIDLSFKGLQSLVQCSDSELLLALEEINALQINNEWRIIDREYLSQCFQDILYCVMEHSIDFRQFQMRDIIRNTSEFPSEIVRHCVRINCVSKSVNANGFWVFDQSKVCVFCAERVLAQNGNKMRESLFTKAWNDCMPYGLEPNQAMLTGHLIAIYDKTVRENVWFVFEEKELSLEAKMRFKQLFERKSEWSKEQIQPYLMSLLKSGMSVDKLLLRHARMVRAKDNNGNEKRTYISRNVKR